MDNIGEALVGEFCPNALLEPQALDVDLFSEKYLGMEQDYQYLSHCGVYLGMTVFNDTNKIVVYNPTTNQAEYIRAKANTIIIDNTLLEPKQEHRYRFTMAHEAAGHGVLHKEYFGYNPNQLGLFDGDNIAMIQCRKDSSKAGNKDQNLWTDFDWMEWQANTLASAFLMPKKMVLQLIAGYRADKRYYEFHEVQRPYFEVEWVSNVFDVSFDAAQYRMKSLRLLRQDLRLDVQQLSLMRRA